VYLVGAGPGEPGLLTLRGAQCLARADVVLYDYLVNPLLLQHCRPEAECICLGQHGRSRLWSQEEINARLVADARAGKAVVRLKSGDPAIFAHYAAEVEVIVQAGLEWEMVPGITAALAASSYAGVPLTHREHASSVALITAHEDPAKSESAHDFAAYAAFPGTLVFYMGVTTAEAWTHALIAAGKDGKTPAAIVRRCSFPDQRVVRCSLAEVAARIKADHIRPPVIVIVGEVVEDAARFSWFDRRPLAGCRIVVTRPVQQAEALARPLRELGAEVIEAPAIEICPPADWSAVDAAIHSLAQFDWLVFSSVNGVHSLLSRLFELGKDLRALGGVRLAAIGPGTAEELAKYHLRADLVPDEFQAEALARDLAAEASGKSFLLARASRGREVLAEQLTSAGGKVTQVIVYDSVDCEPADDALKLRIVRGEIDWVTITSSAIARSVVATYGEALRKTKLASISPITTRTLAELGFTPQAEAMEYTMPGIVVAITAAQAKRQS
jgi:uroporphyrinogen III methyltransferase/synthase